MLHRFNVDAVSLAAFSADGNYVLTSGGFGPISLWNATSGQVLHRFQYRHTTDAMAISPNSLRGVYVTSEYQGVIDLESCRELRQFGRHEKYEPACVAISPTGNRAVVGVSEPDYSLRAASVWDLDRGQELTAPQRAMTLVSCAAFSPDGRRAIAGSEDTSMCLWEVDSGRHLRRIEGHSGNIRSVTFMPDGRRVLSSSGTDYYDADLLRELGIDNTVRLWDIETGSELQRFEGHTANVNCVTVSPDSRYALSGSADKTMRLWTLPG
ncbi:MAG: WD40 repeat domain-containing protein [Vicinamibacterales bacterium]